MNYKHKKIGKKTKLFLHHPACYTKLGVNSLYIGFASCVWAFCNYIQQRVVKCSEIAGCMPSSSLFVRSVWNNQSGIYYEWALPAQRHLALNSRNI